MRHKYRKPKPPMFQSIAEERLHNKQRLTATFRLFSLYGFDEGIAGHVSVRDPERCDHFWVNPFGLYFGNICASDLILVNSKGDVVEGDRPVNTAAIAIHSRVHFSRKDIIAVAHAHTIYGKSWSTLGRMLDPITQDSCSFYKDHQIYNNYSGVVLDASEGDRIADTLGSHKALILQNHGLLTVGKSVDEAAWWLIAMERACQVQLMAEATGKPKVINKEIASLAQTQVGTSLHGWRSFQPLWDKIVQLQPDFLE